MVILGLLEKLEGIRDYFLSTLPLLIVCVGPTARYSRVMGRPRKQVFFAVVAAAACLHVSTSILSSMDLQPFVGSSLQTDDPAHDVSSIQSFPPAPVPFTVHGHLHYAKTGGSTINGMLAAKYEACAGTRDIATMLTSSTNESNRKCKDGMSKQFPYKQEAMMSFENHTQR